MVGICQQLPDDVQKILGPFDLFLKLEKICVFKKNMPSDSEPA